MTNLAVTEEGRPDREHQQAIARKIAQVLMAGFMLFSIWIATTLLLWAVDQRELVATPSNEITMKMRERQLACLTKNIYYEAGGEPFEGKVAVAQVTLNRTMNSDFPNDVCQVIYQKNKVYEKVLCQFSWVCQATSPRPINMREWAESQSVAQKVLLEGFRLPSLENALYFHGDYINPGWKRTKVAHIGRHIFYR